MNMIGKILTAFLFIFLLPVALAQVSHTESDITITADKETYFCQPVLSPDGCLIQSQLTITNDKASSINAFLEFDANKNIAIREYRNRGQSIAVQKSKGKNIDTVTPFLIPAGTTETYNIEFYAQESGKFNYSVFFAGTRITLDPFFNVTYNTTNPSLYLETGFVDRDADSDFIQTNITTELSDLSDITNFQVKKQTTGASSGTLISHYRMDEISGTFMEDSGNFELHGTYNNSPKLDITGIKNTAVNFTPLNSFADVPAGNDIFDLNASESLSICFSLNSFGVMGNGLAILDYREGGNSGYEIKGSAGNKIRLSVDRDGSGAKNTDSNYAFNDNQFHTVCVLSNFTHQTIYVDGTLDREDANAQTGAITSTMDTLYIGADESISSFSKAGIDELCFIKGNSLNFPAIVSQYNASKSCDGTTTQQNSGKAVRTTFPISFNTENEYWLQTRKTTVGIANANVHIYYTTNDSVQPLLTSHSITTGDDVIPLPIVQNETASLRIYTDTAHNISETLLIEQIEDISAPSINAFSVNDTDLFSGDAVRLQANVTDDTSILTVFFTVEDNNGIQIIEADRIMDTDIYFIDITYTNDNGGITESYNFTLINATDIVQTSTTTDPLLSYNYTGTNTNVISILSFFPDPDSIFTNNSAQGLSQGFNFNVNNSGTGELYINGSLNQSISISAGLNEFLDVLFTEEAVIGYEFRAISGNTDTKTGTFEIIFNAPEIIIESPLNNSIQDTTVSVTFDVNVLGNSTLFYTSSLNPSELIEHDTLFNIVGQNTFPEITVSESQNITLFINHTFNPTIQSDSFTIQVVHTPITDEYSLKQCPIDSFQKTFLFSLLLIIALFLVAWGLVQIPILSFMGALLLLVMSLFLYACAFIFGAIFTAISLIAVMISVLKVLKDD